MNLYTARELKLNLARCRQRPLPQRTFQYWKQQLGIAPDVDGFYHESDFHALRELIRAINRGQTIKQFLLTQKENHNATRFQQSRSTEELYAHPIDIAATTID